MGGVLLRQDVLAMVRVGNSMWTAAGYILWVWENCHTSVLALNPNPQIKPNPVNPRLPYLRLCLPRLKP